MRSRVVPLSIIAVVAHLGAASLAHAQTYTLTITGGGTGNGTVTAPITALQPAISCTITAGVTSGRCGGTYPRATTLVLTALSTGGGTFNGWTGICAGTTADCTIRNETGAITATATFTAPVPQCTLTIGTATGGTAALTSGTLTGACGRSVTLTATPATGYRFGSWTGGSTTNPLTLVVNTTAQAIAPSFVAQCALTLAATPTNGGAAILSAGAATGDCGRSVTASASPNVGFTFTSWSDGNANASRPVTVSSASQTLTATFTAIPIPQCTLVIGAATGGSAAVTSGTLTGACGRSVTLTATASTGYRFGSWSGGETANPLTIVTSATTATITPAFIQQCTLTLAASPTDGGTVVLTSGSASGDCGRSVNVAATPRPNFTFTRWSDGVTGASRAVTVSTVNQVLTATFTADTPPPTCSITLGTATGGSATLTSGTASGACGRSVTLTARTDSGYRFDGWSDGASASPYTLVLSAPTLSLTPKFVQQCALSLAVSPADAGTTRFTPAAASGDCGRSVVADALPNANYVFVSWSDQSTASTRAITVSQPTQTLTATFARVLSVRVVVSGASGSVRQLRAGRVACETVAEAVENVCPVILSGPDTLLAVGSSASGFTGWSGACTGRALCAVTGTERDEVRANFISVPPVVADSAAKDLLTGNTLSAAQRDALDKAGNGDGVYNLGDLIALLERTGQQISPDIRARVLAAPSDASASQQRPTTTRTTPPPDARARH